MPREGKNIVKEPDLSYGGLYGYADYSEWNLEETLEFYLLVIIKKNYRLNTRSTRNQV